MLDLLLQELAADPHAPVDVAEVALYLATDEYADLDVPDYLQKLNELAAEARRYATGTLEEQVAGLCSFLYEEEQFTGNADDYYDPRNSYFNDVLDRRLGLPITLSVLAMSIGRRIGMTVEGVGLPGHFIAKASAGDEVILFDPFHDGQILSEDGCQHLIEAVTGQPFFLTPSILRGTPHATIVMRMLNNLKSIYAQQEDYPRTARILQRQRQLNPHDVGLRRDLGITLVRSQQPGPAIDHLQAYLKAIPHADDHDDIRVLLLQAKRDIARWN